MGGALTGLEASRAPYSKSHARRLKRKEKEELAGGGLGVLQAALPSIVPTPTPTPTAASAREASESSAGKQVDAPAPAAAGTPTPTATASAGCGASAKLAAKPKPSVVPDHRGTAPQPTQKTRLGQIGEGKGAPLTRSQRRRALYDKPFIAIRPSSYIRN